MKIKAGDARRILSFCLDGPCDVRIGEVDGRCTIQIALAEDPSPGHLFSGDTFEEVLRAAAEAGVVRRECIERQIAFSRSAGERTFDAKAGQWSGPAFPAPSEPDNAPANDAELTLAHYRGLAEFRYQIRRFVSFSERAARQAGLEPPQHQLLLAVRGLPPSKRSNVSVLAERMCLEVDACQTLADAVVERGFARWTADPFDRRQKLLTLTDAGKSILRSLTILHRNQIFVRGPSFVQALGAILSSFDEAE